MRSTSPPEEKLPTPSVETFTPTPAPTPQTSASKPYMRWQVVDGKLVCQWLQQPD